MREFDSTAELLAWFTELVMNQNPSIVLEIGAREAVFACNISEQLPDSKVFAFEASPFNYELFAPEVAERGGNVEYLHLAMGDYTGKVEFIINEAIGGAPEDIHTGRNSIIPRTEPVTAHTIAVDITTASAFVEARELDGRIVAWIDVEGANGQVLKGMAAVLDRVDLIHCEVEERDLWKDAWLRQDVDDYLAGFGLVPIGRDFEYGTVQYNVIYGRK